MFDIKNILRCPKCGSDLSDDLSCPKCGEKFSYKHGVYNVISMDLSGEQEYLYTDDIPDDASEIFPKDMEMNMEKVWEEYYAVLNKETREAMDKQLEVVREKIQAMSGTVMDLATGGGGMLQNIIDFGSPELEIICTDINVMELMTTRVRRNGARKNISYVATDGRYLAIKDGSVDYITSFAGFGNIPEADKMTKELYRVLKPGGKIMIQDSFIEKGTKSYELACSVGVERGLIEEYILHDLEEAGFKNVKATVVAEAIWAENPYDLIPAAGDNQRFCIIEAEKAE